MKQINEKLNQINKELPYGAKKEIAKKASVCVHTVYKFFKCKPVRQDIRIRILKAVKSIKTLEQKQLANL